jgi:MFS family permease
MNNEDEGRRWIIVAVLFATLFFIWGPINASGVFFVPVVKYFGWSRALFSLLVASAPLAAGISSPWIGSAMDRFGERRIMLAGAAAVAISYFGLSHAQSAAAFLAIFILLGAGITAATIIPTALVITNWFREKRGLALGIAFAGIPLGGTGITIFASQVVQRYGFRAGYVAMALPIVFVVIPLLAIFMRTRPSAESNNRETRAAVEASIPGFEVREAFRTRSFWLIAIAELLFATAGVGLRVHLIPYLTSIGYTPTAAAEIFGAMFLFSAIGTFGVGSFADRLGGRATLATIFVIAAGGIAMLTGATHLAVLCAFVVIFGLVRETGPAVFPIVVGDSLGVRRLGGLLGVGALFNTIGFAAGPVIAGRIFDRTGSYQGALILFTGLALIAALAIRATVPLAEEQARAASAGGTTAFNPAPAELDQ